MATTTKKPTLAALAASLAASRKASPKSAPSKKNSPAVALRRARAIAADAAKPAVVKQRHVRQPEPPKSAATVPVKVVAATRKAARIVAEQVKAKATETVKRKMADLAALGAKKIVERMEVTRVTVLSEARNTAWQRLIGKGSALAASIGELAWTAKGVGYNWVHAYMIDGHAAFLVDFGDHMEFRWIAAPGVIMSVTVNGNGLDHEETFAQHMVEQAEALLAQAA